ncbi:MAG TPA: hypothetical protein PKN75_05325 [Bacteroidia bacterium]|nr:hypothetical protein [Bacteroidia bacterium]HNU32994.1 hypothetical protein [Bacteroidia bacterium]
MKKNLLALTVLALIVGFSACKPREKCPAYGKANVNKHQSKV